jgi:hypothetical protein
MGVRVFDVLAQGERSLESEEDKEQDSEITRFDEDVHYRFRIVPSCVSLRREDEQRRRRQSDEELFVHRLRHDSAAVIADPRFPFAQTQG